MNCSGCTLDAATKDKLMRVPNQILANWLHGHALDEYAIGYDAITLVRLIVVLEMMDKTDDLHSDNWRDFVLRFADSITPTGCFSNHVRTIAANQRRTTIRLPQPDHVPSILDSKTVRSQ